MSHNIEVESGKTVKLPTAGKYCDRDIVVTGFGSNEADLQAKYNEGKTDGLADGAAICTAKHFVYNFVGDGGKSVSFHVPFEPDTVQIIGFDPMVHKTNLTLATIVCDIRAFGQLGGYAAYGNGSTLSTTMFTTVSISTRYSRTEDGVITVQNINSAGAYFGNGFVYTVIAVKYADRSDKERITDFVNGLTGSGTVTLNRAKVNAAFTDDEWAALVATKPNWTFTWI